MVASILAMAPLGAIPPHDPGLFLHWWAELGTSTATMTIARAGAVVVALWMMLLFAGGAVVAFSRSSALARTWHRLTSRRLSRLVVVGSIAIYVSVPSVSGAAESPTTPEVTLIDLGPVEGPAQPLLVPSLTDIGPVARSPGDNDDSRPVKPAAAEPVGDDRWVVAPGDHLWRVAEETLRDHGHDPDDNDVSHYWLRLIDANREIVGDDPDLIHAYQVLILPAVATIRAGS